jgi:hypothetical protein
MLTLIEWQNLESDIANKDKLQIMGTLLKRGGEIAISKHTRQNFHFETIWAIPEYLELNPAPKSSIDITIRPFYSPKKGLALSRLFNNPALKDPAEKMVFFIAGKLGEEAFSLWDFWHGFSLQVENETFKPESFHDWVRPAGTAYFSDSIFDYVGEGKLYVQGWLLFSKEAKDVISKDTENFKLKYYDKQFSGKEWAHLEWSPKKIYTVITTL